MVTVYQVSKSFEITDPKQLQCVGYVVGKNFTEGGHTDRKLTMSEEPDGLHEVWGYPDSYRGHIEKVFRYVLGKWEDNKAAKAARKGPPPKPKLAPPPEPKKKRPRIYVTKKG